MGLRGLVQQPVDGLNESGHTEWFFEPSAHALEHGLFKLGLLLGNHDNRQRRLECPQLLEDFPAHLQRLVEIQQQQVNVAPVVGHDSLLNRGCPENLEMLLFQGTG